MNKPWKHILLVISIAALLGACSSSQTDELGDVGEDELPPVSDAATDAVPQEMLEAPSEEKKEDLVEGPTPLPEPDMAASTASPPAEEPASPPVDTPPAPAPVADSGGGGFESYSVQRGDTLMKIAFETYGDLFKWKDIHDWNRDKISNPNSIEVGTELKLEKASSSVSIDRDGEKYLIKPGDTLGTISDDIYGTPKKWRKLWENNRQLIKDPNRIFAGFYLYYTISPEEREQRNQEKQTAPQPLAQQSEPETGTQDAPPVQESSLSASAPAAHVGQPAESPREPANNMGAPPAPMEVPQGGTPQAVMPPAGAPTTN